MLSCIGLYGLFAGVALGIPPVVALGRVSRTLLYGVESFDPAALAISLAVLLTFAISPDWCRHGAPDVSTRLRRCRA